MVRNKEILYSFDLPLNKLNFDRYSQTSVIRDHLGHKTMFCVSQNLFFLIVVFDDRSDCKLFSDFDIFLAHLFLRKSLAIIMAWFYRFPKTLM